MTVRTSITRPSWLEPCPGCGTEVVYTDRDAYDRPGIGEVRTPIRIDPVDLDEQGWIIATLTGRRIHIVFLDPIHRIRIGNPDPPRPATPIPGARWSTPHRWRLLGYAPRHRCGTTLPGRRIDFDQHRPRQRYDPGDPPPF